MTELQGDYNATTYAENFPDSSSFSDEEETTRRLIDRDTSIDDRHGLQFLRLTVAELAALHAGQVLEVSIQDEYTLVIALRGEEDDYSQTDYEDA